MDEAQRNACLPSGLFGKFHVLWQIAQNRQVVARWIDDSDRVTWSDPQFLSRSPRLVALHRRGRDGNDCRRARKRLAEDTAQF